MWIRRWSLDRACHLMGWVLASVQSDTKSDYHGSAGDNRFVEMFYIVAFPMGLLYSFVFEK